MNSVDGKVAGVLNEYQLAINLGVNKGVIVGAHVSLYSNVEIKDPDNPTILLGVALVKKANLIIESVEENFSVAKAPISNPLLRGFINQPQVKFVVADSNDLVNKTIVAIGDPVKVSIPEPSDD